jgi:hypothetical protein
MPFFSYSDGFALHCYPNLQKGVWHKKPLFVSSSFVAHYHEAPFSAVSRSFNERLLASSPSHDSREKDMHHCCE